MAKKVKLLCTLLWKLINTFSGAGRVIFHRKYKNCSSAWVTFQCWSSHSHTYALYSMSEQERERERHLLHVTHTTPKQTKTLISLPHKFQRPTNRTDKQQQANNRIQYGYSPEKCVIKVCKADNGLPPSAASPHSNNITSWAKKIYSNNDMQHQIQTKLLQ